MTVSDSVTNSEDRGYTYDTAWNLAWLTNNGSASAFTVDNKNQLTNAQSLWTYGYDANGNRTSKQYYTASPTFYYTYDDENRLTSIYDSVGHSFKTDFTYDGLGRLRSRVEYAWTGSSWYPNTTTTYIYDGLRVIQERVGGTPSVSYSRGLDLSGTLEGAGGIGGLLARSHGYSAGNWSTHNFYHADGNGNVTYLVDSSQTLAASYRYDPFGNTLASSGSLAAANVYRFSSKEIHVNSGLYYYLYRFYDPYAQRWVNRDPIEERGGLNLYTFVLNDPIHSYDPLGLDACTDACGRQNVIDIAVCWVVPIALSGGVCYFFPPACNAALKAAIKAALVCTAAAEARYLACLASCATRGKCPEYPIGPYALP